MGYVAVKGGTEAIHESQDLLDFYRLKDAIHPIEISQIVSQLRSAVDKVMGEGGVYSPEYAAIAFKQSEGDVFEAAFILRAFRATLERRFYSETIDTRNMFVKRKISASFREIPGGQILGPTRDYTQRMLNTALANEDIEKIKGFLKEFESRIHPDRLKSIETFPKVIDLLKKEGLLKPTNPKENRALVDITKEAIRFPAPRSARLQMMSRAETGGLMALGYASMRGFGFVHPTVGELRYGAVPLKVKDRTGRIRYLGEIEVTEAEMISDAKPEKNRGEHYYSIGYGLCFGQNDTKVICMGILDTAMRSPNTNAPTHDQEFVLYHTEGIESMGFTNHLKLPHYVTFQSGLSNIRAAMERSKEKRTELVTP